MDLEDKILYFENINFKNINPILEKEIREIGDKQNKRTNLICNIMTQYRTNESSKIFDDFGKWIISTVHDMILDISYIDGNIDYQSKKYLKIKEWLDQLEIDDIWGAVYQKGDYALLHSHAKFDFAISFCYMVNVSEQCSPLIFPVPNKPWESPRIVKPQNGKLIIWNPLLLHYVPPQPIDYERVIVAGNIKLRSKKISFY